MEKQRSTKMIAIIALIAILFGLSIGFAAYSRNLDITNLGATVTPGVSELDVFFDNDQVKDNQLAVVKGVGAGAVTDEIGATITNPVINSGNLPIITGFTANFTAKKQAVVYTFYVYNNSPYSVYLNELSFIDATEKTCEAINKNTTNATLVKNACNDISLSLKIEGITVLSTADSSPVSHTLPPGNWKKIEIEIAYKGNQYPLPDGPMKVTFSGIRIGYSTIKPY
jgi:hypothetical protein